MNPEKLLDALTPVETGELLVALQRRGLVSGVATPEGAAVDAPATTAADFLAQLPADTRARAEAAQAGLVQKFGLGAKDVTVIPVLYKDDAVRPIVILATGNGLKVGSWDDILAQRRAGDLTMEVDGAALDVCAGMTWRAYQALMTSLRARGAFPLPDSREMAEVGGQPWTCTLLTGEDADRGRAPFAFVNEGQPGRSWGSADYVGGFRFRPAAVIT